MKLIIARPSPYSRKVCIALHEKRIPYEETVDIPWDRDTAAPAHNPLGQIPILILENGRTLYDSRVIVDYLETLGYEPALLPGDPQERIAVRQIEALADGICDATVLAVLEESRTADHRSQDWIARQKRKVGNGVAALSRMLGDGFRFVGGQFSLADVAVGSTLDYIALRYPDFDWRARYPNLDAFSSEMEARASFEKTKSAA